MHFHDAEMLAILPVARLLWHRARFVYDVHEDFANLMLVRDWLPGPAKPLVRSLVNLCEKSLARLAHGIVAVTPPLAEKFPHGARVVAFNYATADVFDEAARQSREPSNRKYDLVHLGTLNRRRAAFLARVLQAFHARRPAARSLVLGADERVLEGLPVPLPAGCEVVGQVPFDRVAGFLGDSKVGIDVHPWLSPHLLPALAVKVCEYMACRCAVVASSMPVLETVLAGARLDDAIVRIRGGEPEDYADAAVRLVEAIASGQTPGDRLREFALARMNWDGESRKIAAFYLALLGRRPCAT